MTIQGRDGKPELYSLDSAQAQSGGFVTPWRVILLGGTPGDLLVSQTPLNLAAARKLTDTSWVKPGKAVWEWRVRGYKTGAFTYGVNTASLESFVRFAGKNNIQYFLIDWYSYSVNQGRFEASPDIDFGKIMRLASACGIKILLYYDPRHGIDTTEVEVCRLYSAMGAAGVKYGFKGNNAAFTRAAIQEAAREKLLINFHDEPWPMTGVEGTMPNAITREYCHAQQDSRRAFSPTGFLQMAMINALSGPLDQANGVYGLNDVNQGQRTGSPRKPQSYNSTVVSETARVLVVFSGLIVLPDAPEEYEKKADLFEFIRQMPPATWDETRVLNSKMAEYITTARRSGKQWFIASVINERGGTLEIRLDFLAERVEYDATFFEDAEDSHYINNREAYKVRNGPVKTTDVIMAKMAPGGGHCVWIRPK